MITTIIAVLFCGAANSQTVIRFNRLGYNPQDIKQLVIASKNAGFRLASYRIVNLDGNTEVLRSNQPLTDFGSYGPFRHTFRPDISSIKTPGRYRFILNDSLFSDTIIIGHDVYHGRADYCLRFLRRQRCGPADLQNNPVHLSVNYSIGGPLPDSTIINLSGGWHNTANDAQDIKSGALITGYLLAAYRKFPFVFNDAYDEKGRSASNDRADILDEADWGLNWLVKMHPAKDMVYVRAGNAGMGTDTSYNLEVRPVYILWDSSKTNPAGFKDAAFLSNIYASGAATFADNNPTFSDRLSERAVNMYQWAIHNSGTNNADLFAAALNIKPAQLAKNGLSVPNNSTITEPALQVINTENAALIKQELMQLNNELGKQAFFPAHFDQNSARQVVLTAIKCHDYQQATGDISFAQLEQAAIDWIFGCNAWGTSMVSDMPAKFSPKTTFWRTGSKSAAGALVNGPVSFAAYAGAKGASLLRKDRFADWQSGLAVYHDDPADYMTNQASLEGTAALIYLLATRENNIVSSTPNGMELENGAFIRGDSSAKKIALAFVATGFTGLKNINQILTREKTKASFFIPSDIFKANNPTIRALKSGNYYIGAAGNSNWWQCCENDAMDEGNTETQMQANIDLLKKAGLNSKICLLPAAFSGNFTVADHYIIKPTAGTSSLLANSVPESPQYRSSDSIFQSIIFRSRQMPFGLNGYFLVIPTDAPAGRTDKMFMLLPLLLQELKNAGYQFITADEMLGLKKEEAPVKHSVKVRKKAKHTSKKKRKK